MTEEEIVNRANEVSSKEKRKNSSFRDIVRITLWILILSSIISLLFGFILYDNCTVPSHRWIPQSTEFCTDATRSWTRRQISPTLKENLKKVLISMFGVVSNEASVYLNEVSELGIWDSILVFTSTLHTKLVGLFLLTQRAFGEMKDSLISLFNENSNNLIVEYLKYVAECVVLSLKIALAIGRDLVATAADYAMDLIVWSKDFFTLAMENPSQAWLRFKTILNLA
uniref:Uncharacterized protein n=1 Tax=Acrobeloides nanus TaxID=290746 RepID=A0A914EMY5_9BILA